jgi:hypothetical protein
MTAVETVEKDGDAQSARRSKIVALVVAVSFFMQILDGTIVTTSCRRWRRASVSRRCR